MSDEMIDEARPGKETPGWSYLLVPFAPAIIWIVYFMIVYLYAEAGCAFGWDEPAWFGLHGVTVVTAVATVVSLAAIAYYTSTSWRRFRHPNDHSDTEMTRALGLLGLVLGMIFIPATIAIAAFTVTVPAC